MAQKAVTEKNIKKYIEKAREKQLLPNKILDELEQKLGGTGASDKTAKLIVGQL